MKQIIEERNYEKELVMQRRLENVNKGYTFENIDAENRKLKVEFLLSVDMNLEERKEEIIVQHNLNLSNNPYYSGEQENLENFFSALNNFATTPFYVPRTFNRKNKLSDWELNKIAVRKTILNFADINIVVYEEADKSLKQKKIDVVK